MNLFVNMFNFFGGVTHRIKCDNLKVGVISHPKNREIILNETYKSFGDHYNTFIAPAGVRKPKQKASVEGTVGKIATFIIAKLRNEVFYSLHELQKAIINQLTKFNEMPFQKKEGSRKSIFLNEEKTELQELPLSPFEISHWVYQAIVGFNFHISFDNNYYSVPYTKI